MLTVLEIYYNAKLFWGKFSNVLVVTETAFVNNTSSLQEVM